MSITPVPISMRLVRAPIAASSGNGEANWRWKWWTRKKAPSMPISSAATDSSTAWRSASPAVVVSEPGAFDQWPKLRKPMRLRCGESSVTAKSLQATVVGRRGSGAVDDEDAAVAVVGDRAGDAAEQRVFDPGEAARAERDHRRVVLVGGLHDRTPDRPAFGDRGGRLEAKPAGPLGSFLGGRLGAFLGRVGEQLHRLRLDRHPGGAEERHSFESLGDDQHDHFA